MKEHHEEREKKFKISFMIEGKLIFESAFSTDVKETIITIKATKMLID
jgi:hypothetical protein